MLNPDAPPRPAVTGLQARALCNATPEPQSASALNNSQAVGARAHLLDTLVTAGFLTRHIKGRRVLYAVTPDGEAFAAFLYRMEAAREAL